MKRFWKKPTFKTVGAQELSHHIQAAARSISDEPICDFGHFR